MAKDILTYTNGEITVVWQPKLCTHSTLCWKGLINVFNPRVRPWVNMNGSTSARIIEQVKKCPSGALSIGTPEEEPTPLDTKPLELQDTVIQIAPNGPLLIQGPCIIKHADGQEERKEKAALCRCGASANKPFCDGSHNHVGFAG